MKDNYTKKYLQCQKLFNNVSCHYAGEKVNYSQGMHDVPR